MGHGRFVTAGNDGGGPVAGAHVLDGGDDVYLADHPFAGVFLPEGHVADGAGAAAVDADIAAPPSDIEQIFV